ncbi:MAG TPA: TonB-dependent receptor [Thermoanaerobaculia bacterium]|jgi:outer membrane receptor protein involved in Fe transport
MHSRTRSLFVALLAMLCITGAAFAQSVNVTTGAITGTVTDSSGAALPGVTVTVTGTDTGLTRNTVTESDGTYTFQLLQPGRYRVVAELAGLGTAARPNVTVLLGNTTRTDIVLNPQLAEQITVTAEAPVVDTEQSGLTSTVTETQIDNLPILGRDFRSLAELTPGVTSAFGGRLTGNGGRGITTDFNIDGAESNSDFFGEQRGGTRAPFTFSQAAIREFQVIRSQYAAEYGRGVGTTINAITKSGTNDLDGEVFYFLRRREWAATRARQLNGVTVEDAFRAKDSAQPGFALGGPIVRDRLFYFVNADFQRESLPVVPNDFRQDTDFQALPENVRNAYISKLEGLLGYSIEEELATYDTTADQNTYLIKFDANIGSRNHVWLRDNLSDFDNKNNQSSFNFRSNQGNENDRFNQIVGSAETIVTNSAFNQLIVQYSADERPITPTNVVPTEFIVSQTGISNMFFGNNDFLPNNTEEKKWQLKESFTFLAGNHNFKAGVDALWMSIDNLFPRNRGGVYRYPSVQRFLDNQPNQFQQGFGEGGGLTSWEQNTYGFFAQDSWRPVQKLTLDYGLRYDFQTIPVPERNVYPNRPEFIENFQEDRNNWAPRLGFAYDLLGTGSSVIRGGVGKFYNYLPSILLSNPLTQISGNFTQYTINCSATLPCPTFPNILTQEQLAALPPSTIAAVRDITIVSDDLEAQESWRTNLQFEQQLGQAYSVGIGGTYAKLDKIQALINVNAVPLGYSFGNLPVYNANGGTGSLYPEFREVRQHVSDEEASYQAYTLETKKLALGGSRLSWNASYTWAKSIDQDTNERSTSASFRYDPFNPSLSEGPSQNDVRHRVVLSGTYELPWGILVSGIGSYRSGVPYVRSIGVGSGQAQVNGLFNISEAFPVFLDRDGEVIDLTQANGMTRPEFAAFLAARGATIEQRNSQRQPYFKNVDMRLAKTFGLPAGFEIELIGEVFNLLNWENRFISGTNQRLFTYSLAAATDRVTFTRNNSYGQENSFVGNSNPRQFQVAAKIRF